MTLPETGHSSNEMSTHATLSFNSDGTVAYLRLPNGATPVVAEQASDEPAQVGVVEEVQTPETREEVSWQEHAAGLLALQKSEGWAANTSRGSEVQSSRSRNIGRRLVGFVVLTGVMLLAGLSTAKDASTTPPSDIKSEGLNSAFGPDLTPGLSLEDFLKQPVASDDENKGGLGKDEAEAGQDPDPFRHPDAAITIEVGEGLFNTFSELGIPSEYHASLMQRIGRQFVKGKLAYVHVNLDGSKEYRWNAGVGQNGEPIPVLLTPEDLDMVMSQYEDMRKEAK